MSSARRKERAATKAVEIAERKAAKEAAKVKSPPRPAIPAREPSANPYREPEPAVKKKRVIRTVSERDGLNLLRKIEAKGGRDIIVMMRDSQQPPQELAANLMHDETIVIACLNSYGSSKNQLVRLLTAIEQAPLYLKNDGVRTVTAGVKKQKRQEETRARREEIASRKKNPKPRVLVVPTVEEVVPKLSDGQIVLEELKKYLEHNPGLGGRVIHASTDDKAANILWLNVGQRFDIRVKALLAEPSKYKTLLAEAGATIRREARKYDTPITTSTGPVLSVQESPEALARYRAQEDVLNSFVADTKVEAAQADADNPEEEAKRELFSHQEDLLKRFREADDE